MKTTEVILYNEVDTGQRDKTKKPITDEVPIWVPGVLIAPVSTDDVVTTINLTGRTAVYQIAIPKGDQNNWENA